jgi:protein tyrosine phosphatase (PTP) superfamily phosphohydrolase (DUF442 family)
MDDSTFRDVYNYRRISEHVVTGGQPTEAQLAAIASAGCKTVINIGLHDADYALPDERGLVESLGMEYIYIPVIWDSPSKADLVRFCDALAARQDQDVFVHCAANKRVAAFIALDRILRQGWAADDALRHVHRRSFPKVWRAFMDDVLGEHT